MQHTRVMQHTRTTMLLALPALLALIVLWISVISTSVHATELELQITLEPTKDDLFVTEKVLLSLDTKSDIEAFTSWIEGGSLTIVEGRKWAPRYLGYHIAPKNEKSNATIVAKREPTIFNGASITLTYTAKGIVHSEREGRITRYAITNLLGEGTALPRYARLTLRLPNGAELLYARPPPTQSGSELRWEGPMGGSFSISYAIEEPLSEEVVAFFLELFNYLQRQWLLTIIAAALLIAAITLARKMRKQSPLLIT